MYDFLSHKQAPLPFQGQKRNFIVQFAQQIQRLSDDTIFVDLFGGSGLLSRAAKDCKPNCRVIYNDFDNYRARIEAIPSTNALLEELRPLFSTIPKNAKVTPENRQKAMDIIKKYDKKGVVDYITLSSSVLFSAKYANNLDELCRMKPFYNNFKSSKYKESSQYLDGLEWRSCDYKHLFNEFKDNPKAFFICDPPYLSTDTTTYKSYWKLRDYLDVLDCLQGTRFAYFTSNKSTIIELLEWLQNKHGIKNPFADAIIFQNRTTLNYNAAYNDIMIFKE